MTLLFLFHAGANAQSSSGASSSEESDINIQRLKWIEWKKRKLRKQKSLTKKTNRIYVTPFKK